MSTKIYNAYLVCDNKVETVFKIKKELEPLYELFVSENLDIWGNVLLKNVKKYLPENLINWKWFTTNDFDSPVNELSFIDLKVVLDGYIRSNQNAFLNFEASMVLIEHKQNLYVQFFGLDNSFFDGYFESMKKSKILVDRHYQNSTDQPDDISDEDWGSRRSMWDELYDGIHNTPAQIGFCYDFFSMAPHILRKYTESRKKTGEASEAK